MNEMPVLLRFAMRHFAGGDAFLAGLLLFVVCQGVLLTGPRERLRRGAVLLSRLGVIWGGAVLCPVPFVCLTAFGVSLVGLWWCRRRPSVLAAGSESETMSAADASSRRRERRSQLFAISAALMLMGFELPYRFTPRLDDTPDRLLIVADSVTAGLNDGEDTWPQRLARTSSLDIVDASQPGATLKSALGQVALLETTKGGGDVLLLEIGGNDLLEGLPPAQFEHDLNKLLSAARSPKWKVWMFELPLPPLSYRLVEAQRRLARQQDNVKLIPRRYLLKVLTTAGSTVDGIHLSPQGHQQLAEIVRGLVVPAQSTSEPTGRYHHVDPPGGPKSGPSH